MTKRRAREPPGVRIEIDIDGVKPTTKISQLTVAQLVQLTVQLSEQLGAARPSRADRQERAREAVARLCRVLQSNDEHVTAIKRAFKDLRANLPSVLMEILKATQEHRADSPTGRKP
jgi:hypothetical protein